MNTYRARNVNLVPDGNFIIATGDVEFFDDPDWNKIGEFNTTVPAEPQSVAEILDIARSVAKIHTLVSDLIPQAIQIIESTIIEIG